MKLTSSALILLREFHQCEDDIESYAEKQSFRFTLQIHPQTSSNKFHKLISSADICSDKHMLKKTYIIDNIAFFLTFFLRKYKKTVSILIHHVKSQRVKTWVSAANFRS